MKVKLFIGIVSFFLLSTQSISATETIKLKFPIVDSHSKYYYNILETALTNAGYQAQIEKIELPSQRAQLLPRLLLQLRSLRLARLRPPAGG